MKVDISKLKSNPDNPRQISKEKFDLLKKSIREFPEMLKLRPLIIDKDNIVLGGNMRLRAMIELGYKEVDVIQADKLTEAQKKEFVIKDNSSFGSYDWDLITNLGWVDLPISDWGVDLPVDFGTELEAVEDDFDVPVGGLETDIVLGDLFEIGSHRLLCGDSTCSDTVAKLMNGEKAELLLTDPPYGINANNQTLGSGKKEFYRGENWDKEIPNFFYLISMFEKCIIWGGNYFADKLPISNDWLCWDKKNPNLSFSEFELAWSNIGKNCRIISHHWSGEKKLHPTMKPVPVMAWCLSFLKSETIFDPFLGSGTTLIASHQLNRKCYGMELDPKYCQVIVDRMIKLAPDIEIKLNGKKYMPKVKELTE